MAELDSTLRTRFAQIKFAAKTHKPEPDTGLATDTGFKNPLSSKPLTTQPIATRDVKSVTFSVIPHAATGESPKPQPPIAPPPELTFQFSQPTNLTHNNGKPAYAR